MLLSLPLEILQQIADCVETVHRPSLYALSLTSKACHRASAVLIFRQLHITVDQILQHDMDRLARAISRTDSAHHVRCINIKGALRLNGKNTGNDACWVAKPGPNEALPDDEPISYGDRYVVYDQGVIEKSSEEDKAWAPVVNLLQVIPHLRDLVYDCQSQFPPSLLQILHEQHPYCRLHHLTFRFRTLLWGVPYPYEMELATSPCLYRVKVACSLRDSDVNDFNSEAIMELAAMLAPNLKEVTVLTLEPYDAWRYRRPRGTWEGLPGFTGEAFGSLTSLSLKGRSELSTLLRDWSKRTDFACLEHLTLGKCKITGDTMEWLAQNHSFPRLRTLDVYLSRDDSFHDRPHYSEQAISFFQALGPLVELSINGPIDSQILDAILARHGQTLQKLSLYSSEEYIGFRNGRDQPNIPMEFTKDHILQIQAQCPVLEDLAIPVKRNKSNASEAEIYRCFSKIKSLRFLFLTLDCSNWRATRDSTYNPDFDGEDQKPLACSPHLKRGHWKETLINCAVDESLARSIWKIISQNKMGRQMERLKLWTTGGGKYGTQGGWSIGSIIYNLSRSWLIERVPQDQEDITIRELRQRERAARDANTTLHLGSEIQQIFREIWPCKEGSEDWPEVWKYVPGYEWQDESRYGWQNDWWSFPLQV